MPRVTLLLATGILLGEQALNLIPLTLSQRYEVITNLALLMIGFLLGSQLSLPALRGLGPTLLWVSLCAAVTTSALVAPLLYLAGMPVDIAILLGCIAAVTAPAATTDTVIESGINTRFSRLLLAVVASLGLLGLIYVLARALGKVAGAWLGARVAKADRQVRRWMGIALLPQAGVAIGMALLTAHRFPQHAQMILSLVIAATVVFELLGPVLTRVALRRSSPCDDDKI
ncbi:MAG: cation:proton antiporter [Candidatus Thiodiazotropha sp.]